MKRIFFLTALLGFTILSSSATSVASLLNNSLQKPADQPTPTATPHEKRIQFLESERSKALAAVDAPAHLRKVSAELDSLREQSKSASTKERAFFDERIPLLSKQYQVLTDIEQVQQQIVDTVVHDIKLAQDYAADPDFKNILAPVKAVYDFDDVHNRSRKITEMRTKLVEAEKSKVTITEDLSKKRKALSLIQDEYKDKKQQQEAFAARFSKSRITLSAQQEGQLLDDQKRLLEYRKQLAELRVVDNERKLALAENRIKVYREQLVVLKKEYNRIKRSARVDKAYVRDIEKKLEEKRQLSVAARDQSNERLRLIASANEEVKEKIDEAVSRFKLSTADLHAIRSLNRDPKTILDWNTFAITLNSLTDELVLEIERDYLLAQIDFEKAQFRKEELAVAIIRTWQRMTDQKMKFNTEEEVEQEIKSYTAIKAELEGHVSALLAERDMAINSLQTYNAMLDKIKQLSQLLRTNKRALFRDNSALFDNLNQLLQEVSEKIRSHIDLIAKMVETYSTTLALAQESIKKVEMVNDELTAKGFWMRSDQSIEWDEVKNFIPDIRRFFDDFRRSTAQFFTQPHMTRAMLYAHSLFMQPVMLLLLLLSLAVLGIIFMLLKLYIPDVQEALFEWSEGYGFSLARSLSLVAAGILDFIQRHLISIYIWSVLWLSFFLDSITNVYLEQLFYLLTIPYGLYLIYHLLQDIYHVNKSRNYSFMGESYQVRFLIVMGTLLTSGLIILCIREAFILQGFRNSQVPTILLACVFIVCQVAAIGLIGRDQILGILHKDTPFWEWVYEHVSQYYYFVWLAVIIIIVMTNPYVGLVRQVYYIISRLVFTLLLIPIFSWVHNRVKRASVDLFFYYTDSEAIKERFPAGKFLYGLFVVTSFLLFLVVSIYVGGRLWGMPITLREMNSWLNYSFYSSLDEAGRQIEVTVLSIAQIFVYILGGIVLAYVINRLVLRRLFDPFLVGVGVQSTILTLTRYFIIIVAVFMGLSNAGLGGLTTKLTIILGALAFAAQEPIRDFFSYFVLLVQRPVKIGDYIQVVNTSTGADLRGVVRHITPRSLLLRARNSVTVIIPNSQVILNPVINWSYSRNFFAFDDFFITIPYACDPIAARELMLKVFEENPHVLRNPPPVVRLEGFVDNGYQFMLRGYLTADKVLDQWDIASDFRLELVRTLRTAGIEVASPIRTLKFAGAPSEVDKQLEKYGIKPIDK